MLKNFQLHITPDHFPGFLVTQPFYIIVQYRIKDGKFDGVQGVTFPFTAIGTLHNSARLGQEIEDAALNNFNSLVKPKVVEMDQEAINNLKSKINY